MGYSTAVGGLFTSLKLWEFPSKDNSISIGDANKLISSGVYRNYPSDINMPPMNSSNNGILVVLPVNEIMVLQGCYYGTGILFLRQKWGMNWTSWRSVSLT